MDGGNEMRVLGEMENCEIQPDCVIVFGPGNDIDTWKTGIKGDRSRGKLIEVKEN
jgi:hypothetical protein